MKNVLVVLGFSVLMSSAAFAQGSYYVDYFSNNNGPADQILRIVNVGTAGTPLTSPRGDVCANIYVFDNNQEMIACCACRLTPNELLSAYVGPQLTNNPVTSVVPTSGVIKIVLSDTAARPCAPVTALEQDVPPAADFGRVWGTHLQVTGGRTYVSETAKLPSPLSAEEAVFLPSACSFAWYLGSGKGRCGCSVPGD